MLIAGGQVENIFKPKQRREEFDLNIEIMVIRCILTVAALARWRLIGQFVAQGIEGIQPITEANNMYI